MAKELIPPNLFTGNNTFDTYYLGLFYRDYILQKEYYPYQFDDWFEKRYYGRYDSQKNIIYPKKSFLKNHNETLVNNHRNLNFVTDAFIDLKNFYDQLQIKEKITKSSIYTKLNPSKTTTDVESDYADYIKNLYPIFERFFITDSGNGNPYSLRSFITRFVSFLDLFLNFNVLNRSSYIKSNNVIGNVDGLRISLDDIKGNVSYVNKANFYIGNEQFDSFIKNCARFGFFIDKNNPWTIIFDLDSPVLKEYSAAYGLYNKDQILDTCYYKAYKADLENLNNLVVVFWNNYVAKHASASITIESSYCTKTYVENTSLQQISQESFERLFDITWQLRFYAYTRIKESRIKIPQQKFEILHTDACKIAKLYTDEEAVLFINKKIDEFLERSKPNNYYLTSEQEFYKLLGQQAKNFTGSDLRF